MAADEVLAYLYLPLWVPDRRNWKSALYTQLQLDWSWEEDEVTKNAACLGIGSLFLTGFLLSPTGSLQPSRWLGCCSNAATVKEGGQNSNHCSAQPKAVKTFLHRGQRKEGMSGDSAIDGGQLCGP